MRSTPPTTVMTARPTQGQRRFRPVCALGASVLAAVLLTGCGVAHSSARSIRPSLRLPALGPGSNPAPFEGPKNLAHWEAVARAYPHNEQAQLAAGIAAFQNQQPQRAIRYYEVAARLAPHDATPANNIGNVYRLEGQYAAAIRWYRKALAIDPHNPNAWLNLAWTENQVGDHAAVRATVAAALKALPATSPVVPGLKALLKQG